MEVVTVAAGGRVNHGAIVDEGCLQFLSVVATDLVKFPLIGIVKPQDQGLVGLPVLAGSHREVQEVDSQREVNTVVVPHCVRVSP